MSEKAPRPNMFESNDSPEDAPTAYIELLKKIQDDPSSSEVWESAVSLAKEEEVAGRGSESYYTSIPLDELITIGERLKETKERNKFSFPDYANQEQYSILTEKSSTGEYWYDIILGHVNDKMFAPVRSRLEILAEEYPNKKMGAGLDLGSGLGNTIRDIAPYFEKVVGVEKLPLLANLSKENPATPKNVEIICADALYTKLPNESFDVAVSNGLTRYLPRHKVDNYAREISRVLKDGGRYLEAYTIKKPNDRLPYIEQEYLTSAKALVVCLLDNIITEVDEDNQSWNSSEMISAFTRNGVFLRRSIDSESEKERNIKETGIVVAEFIKNKRYQAKIKKGGYSSSG